VITVVFIGTFDPLHGAHIGQLLRAHRYRPFDKALIAVIKHPLYKPQASPWQNRLALARLTLAASTLPFAYELITIETPIAYELSHEVDYNVTGIDSLLEVLAAADRVALAQRWPMLVLSVPGVSKQQLDHVMTTLPAATAQQIRYEYVSEAAVPMLNYDFEAQTYISRRVHSRYIRSGADQSLLPEVARAYIRENGLYGVN
jgi:nicotinic acid mononucleotide adenylyltransferase